MRKVIVTNIKWDLDDEEDAVEIRATLPKRMEFDVDDNMTDDEIEEWLSDAITDETEWCHGGFSWHFASRK